MTDHRRTVAMFLRTDLFRLEAAAEGRAWTDEVAARLAHHLRYAALLEGVYLQGRHPTEEALQAQVEAIAPTTWEAALAAAQARMEAIVGAMEAASDARLHAPVLDRHERGLTVLGHLYDFCRASATVVEWVRGLPAASEQAMESRLRSLVGNEEASTPIGTPVPNEGARTSACNQAI